MTRHRVFIETTGEEGMYLDSCARVRGLSAVELMRRIVRTVLSEQLVLSVLDDDAARVHDSWRYAKPEPEPLFAGLAPNVQHLTAVDQARTRARVER